MRRWVGGFVAFCVAAVGLSAATPAHASGITTYSSFKGGEFNGQLVLAIGLDSSDRRCTYGRTVKLQEFFDGSWHTVGSDTPKASPVAGFKIPLTENVLRALVPAKSLSDGTRCAAAIPMPEPTPLTRSAQSRVALIGPNIAPVVATESWVGSGIFSGVVYGVGEKCRKNRLIRYQVQRDSVWVTISKDVTGAKGVYGVGGELPSSDPLRIQMPAKTVNGTLCEAMVYGIAF